MPQGMVSLGESDNGEGTKGSKYRYVFFLSARSITCETSMTRQLDPTTITDQKVIHSK